MPLDERAYWLGFSRVPGVGRVTVDKLLAAFGSLGGAWHADPVQLGRAGVGAHAIQTITDWRAKLDLAAELRKLDSLGARFIIHSDTDYPTLLRPLRAAPPVLYVMGDLSPADERALAVVGTRKATRYGRDMAERFCGALAQAGVTIISGLALGIDAAAHTAALDAGGRTLAVLGCGIDVVYPRENAALLRRIVESGQGALITQYPPGTRPDGGNFPRRNAVLSGLALGTLVVEAPDKSGSLHTVSAALDQGREVFAIPHNLTNLMGAACNRLIQDGAKLVIDPADVLDELNITAELLTTRATAQKIAPDSPEEARLLAHLSDAPIHIDDLARAAGMSAAEVSVLLTLLELKGLAQRVGPMQYCGG